MEPHDERRASGISREFCCLFFNLGYLRLCNGMYDLGDLQNREKHISNWQVNKCLGDNGPCLLIATSSCTYVFFGETLNGLEMMMMMMMMMFF